MASRACNREFSPPSFYGELCAIALLGLVLLLATGLTSFSTQKRYAAYAMKGLDGRWLIFDRRPTEEELDPVKPGGPGSPARLYEAILVEDEDRYGWDLSEMGKRRRSTNYKPPETFDISLGAKSTISLNLPGVLTPEQLAASTPRIDVPPELVQWMATSPAEAESLREAVLDHQAVEHARLVSRLRRGETTVDTRPSTLQLVFAGTAVVLSPIAIAKLVAMFAQLMRVVRI